MPLFKSRTANALEKETDRVLSGYRDGSLDGNTVNALCGSIVSRIEHRGRFRFDDRTIPCDFVAARIESRWQRKLQT